jgi:GNAT superfamily N-acetyltransferase
VNLRRTAAQDRLPEPPASGHRPVHDHTPVTFSSGAGTAGGLLLREVGYDHPDAVALVSALFSDQHARYGYADPTEADPAEYRPPAGAFLVAYLQGRPVACGGYRPHRPSAIMQDTPGEEAEDPVGRTIEIKKMYTVPEHRGHGYGRQMLAELERRATDAGAEEAILETGVRNRSALALYTGAGYRPAASYVPGRDPAINRAFTKPLGLADPVP